MLATQIANYIQPASSQQWCIRMTSAHTETLVEVWPNLQGSYDSSSFNPPFHIRLYTCTITNKLHANCHLSQINFFLIIKIEIKVKYASNDQMMLLIRFSIQMYKCIGVLHDVFQFLLSYNLLALAFELFYFFHV